MQTETCRRPYTPQFTNLATVSVRRLAWALNKSMPKTVDIMVKLMPSIVSSSKVCSACQDKSKCQSCIFHNPDSEVSPQLLETLEKVF